MYKVNIEGAKIIKHIQLQVLVVYDVPDDTDTTVLIGNEMTGKERPDPQTILDDEVQQWLDDNIKGGYKVYHADIIFNDEDEAILFKTTWI